MEDVFLVKPSKEYEESFGKYVLAYKSIDDKHYFNMYKRALEDFNGYLEELDKATTMITPLYDVITSTFWLIYNSNVVGVVRVRHEEVDTAGHIGYDISPLYRNKGFGSEILRLALAQAKKIGLKEVIVTCSVDNAYSKGIIEKNKGKFLGIIYDDEEDENLYKYSIDIDKYIV